MFSFPKSRGPRGAGKGLLLLVLLLAEQLVLEVAGTCFERHKREAV